MKVAARPRRRYERAGHDVYGRTPLVFATSANRIDVDEAAAGQGRRPQGWRRPSSTTARDRLRTLKRGRHAIASSPRRPGARRTPASTSTIRRRPGRRRCHSRSGERPAAPAPAAAERRARRGMRAPTDIEQIGRQGGFTALHYAIRDGYAEAAALLLDAGMDMNRPHRRRPIESDARRRIINGQYDLAMTSARARRRSESRQRRWRGAVVCGDQQRVAAAHLVSAADRRIAAEGVVSAPARSAAQSRRRPERAHGVAHLVRRVQHRPHGRGVHRRNAVLARRLRARRGRHAPAREIRRRSDDSDDDVWRGEAAERSYPG